MADEVIVACRCEAQKKRLKRIEKPGSQQQVPRNVEAFPQQLGVAAMKTKSQTFVSMVSDYDEQVCSGSSLTLIK